MAQGIFKWHKEKWIKDDQAAGTRQKTGPAFKEFVVKLYIMDIKEVEQNGILEERMFASIGKQRQEKIEKCRHDRDKIRSLCAGALLCLGVMEWEEEERDFSLQKIEAGKANWEMLSEFFGKSGKEVVCRYGGNGKPFFVNYPHIQFNLSHSGDYVVAAFDSQPGGIDIQEHRKINDSMSKHFLNDREVEMLSLAANEGVREKMLCKLWTVKESYIKLTGEGMKKSMREIFVNRANGKVEDEKGEVLAGFREKIWREKYYISVCGF